MYSYKNLVGNWVGRPLRKAAELVLTREDRDAQNRLHRHLAGLFRRVLAGDGTPGDADFEAVRFALRTHPSTQINAITGAMRHHAEPVSVAELTETFSGLEPAEREELLRVALALGIGAGRMQENHDFLLEFADGIGMDRESFNELEHQLMEAEEKHRKLLRSGAGIMVALIVIAIFILTATLLRSVIFGLIGAYVMLPLEKFFERKLKERGSLLSRIYRGISACGAPFRSLAAHLQKNRKKRSEAEQTEQERQLLISRAVLLTVLTLLLAVLVLVGGLGSVSGRFVRQWRDRAATQTVAAETNAAAAAKVAPAQRFPERLIARANETLTKLRQRFDRNPLVQSSIAHVSRMLNDPATQQELIKQILKRTGGVFAFTAGVLGGVCAIVADLLLTVFFFLLFLSKLAEFHDSDNSAWQGDYLVRTVFGSAWLPGAGEGTLLEAQRIISEIINRLKTWLKGYLTLVLVDASVYTVVFYLLNVPYFFILGPLAGCGILLPYIGPIISCVLTLAVTLASGGGSVSSGMLISILAAYLIYNGVIEQFILYPMVIGESLGLTTLETIIVVLLGAIFAGIAGMLLAIPAASVLKYLVPQIYHCFDRQKKSEVL